MKNYLTLIFVGAIFVGPSITFAQSSISGAEVINNNCARCHNARSVDEFSIEEWSVIMPHMREKAHLSRQESEAALLFLQTILTSPPPQASAVIEGESGAELATRFACMGCHSINGVGGTVGPVLDDVVDLKGLEYFVQKLQNPQFNNSVSAMPKMPLSDEQIHALAEYFR